MVRRRPLIATVVSVNVLGELWLCLADPFRGPESFLAYVLFGMIPAHGSLLAFWAAFGGRASPWRLVIGLAAVVGLLWVAEQGDDLLVELWTLLPLQLLPTSVLLLCARFFGAELRRDRLGETPPPPEPERQWVQFSIRSLLSWTTALALLLSLSHFLPNGALEMLREIVSDSEGAMVFSAIVLGNMLISFGAMWITLGTRWPLARYVVLASAGTVAASGLVLTVGMRELGSIVVFCCAEVAWMAGSLWLIRLAGYRLVWRRRVRL